MFGEMKLKVILNFKKKEEFMKELQELAQKRFDELTKQKTAIEAELKPLKEYLTITGATVKRGRKAGDKGGTIPPEVKKG